MASRLLIDVDLENAAFEEPNTGAEIARILRDAADRLNDVDSPFRIASFDVYDANGNWVGKIRLSPPR